eukprot:146302_1
MSSVYYSMYSASLTVMCIGVLMLIICQSFADKYGKHKIHDNVAKILLYGVYMSALICGLFGFSLHASKSHPLWCETYGIPPCFGVLGATKAFLYGFFLRRARKANVVSIKMWSVWFDIIGPIYIFIYWLVYVILASIFLRGKANNNNNENDIISWCLFNSWRWWFVIFANVIDLINCIVTLLLFAYPLLQSINRLKRNDTVNKVLLIKFINALKWNVFLSFIATVSSIVTLISVPIVKQFIWFFCVGDPFINSICVFMMMASNRKFFKNKCKPWKWCHENHNLSQSNVKNTNDLASHIETTLYNMDEIVSDIVHSTEVNKNKSIEKQLSSSYTDLKKITPLAEAILTLQKSKSRSY